MNPKELKVVFGENYKIDVDTKGFVVKTIKGISDPVIDYDGIPQRFTIVMTAEEEENVFQSVNNPKYCD